MFGACLLLNLSLLAAAGMASPLHSAFHSNITELSVTLGVTDIKLTREEFAIPAAVLSRGHAEGVPISYAFLNLHENENTSVVAARSFLLTHGGSLVKFHNGNSRLISFRMAAGGALYSVDPNRIFTEEGIVATMKNYGTAQVKTVLNSPS